MGRRCPASTGAFVLALSVLALAAFGAAPRDELQEIVQLETTRGTQGKAQPLRLERQVMETGRLTAWLARGGPVCSLEVEVRESREEGRPGGEVFAPCVAVDVEAGDVVRIVIRPLELSSTGLVEIHLVTSPETNASRAAASAARDTLAEARALASAGQLGRLRAVLEQIDDELAGFDTQPPGAATAEVSYDLGFFAYEHRYLPLAERFWKRARTHMDRALPPEHPRRLFVQQNCATVAFSAGRLDEADELFARVIDVRRGILPPGHSDLLDVMMGRAGVLRAKGDLPGSLRAMEEILAVQTELSPGDPRLLRTRANYALLLRESGQLAQAIPIQEEVLDAWGDSTEYMARIAMMHLTTSKLAAGDLAGAHFLVERALLAAEDTLGADHPETLLTRLRLADVLLGMRDYDGARAVYEDALARAESAGVPERDLAVHRMSHAQALNGLGLSEESERALRALMERWEESGYPHDFLARTTRSALAAVLIEKMELEEARLLLEDLLEDLRKTSPSETSEEVILAKQNLGVVLRYAGDSGRSVGLDEEVFAVRVQRLPPDHHDLLDARLNLIGSIVASGDLERALPAIGELLDSLSSRAISLRLTSPRLARQGARDDLARLFDILGSRVGGESPRELDAPLFSVMENIRHTSLASSAVFHSARYDTRLSAAWRAVGDVRERTQDHVVGGPPPAEAEVWRSQLLDLVRERDRLEAEFRELLDLESVGLVIDKAAVASALAPDELAVSYIRYRYTQSGSLTPKQAFAAFVVRPDGRLRRHDLGDAAEIDELVLSWRWSLGHPLSSRGVGLKARPTSTSDATRTGARLRTRVLDPLLVDTDGVTTIHLVLDDTLHLVPFDALVLEDGLVGDRYGILYASSFGSLIAPSPRPEGAPTALLLGDVDYSTSVPGVTAVAGASAPPVRVGTRTPHFIPLPGTAGEIEALASLYARAFEREAQLLRGKHGDKAALVELAPGARFLHLATHGWFWDAADDEVKGPLATGQPLVAGLAPDTLCGLALAGADLGPDGAGRVPGILTAEELAGLDLSRCELAVLSACETNVGLHESGQGIRSLQTALHAAGARTAITSLWKVGDSVTRTLMEHFYEELWFHGATKAEALWSAKMSLRRSGSPLQDWAGWVLSGARD